MADIDVSPLVLKDCVLVIDGDNYEKGVSGVKFIPKSSTIAWQGLTPESAFTDASTPEWTCQIDYVQDWDTTDSLSRYLLANAGATVAASFKPKAAGTPSFAANIVIAPGQIGGDVNKYATTSVTLGCDTPVPTYV